MTIKQAKRILGKAGEGLTSSEIEEMLVFLAALADVFIEQQMGVENGEETDLH